VFYWCRSQWRRGLRRGFAAALLLRLQVPFPLRAWISLSHECCMLSDGGLCVGLIVRAEEAYQVSCLNVIVKLR
jgi:hypothetical protein